MLERPKIKFLDWDVPALEIWGSSIGVGLPDHVRYQVFPQLSAEGFHYVLGIRIDDGPVEDHGWPLNSRNIEDMGVSLGESENRYRDLKFYNEQLGESNGMGYYFSCTMPMPYYNEGTGLVETAYPLTLNIHGQVLVESDNGTEELIHNFYREEDIPSALAGRKCRVMDVSEVLAFPTAEMPYRADAEIDQLKREVMRLKRVESTLRESLNWEKSNCDICDSLQSYVDQGLSNHRADIDAIGNYLLSVADDLGKPQEYDRLVERLNADLNYEFPAREKDHYVTVSTEVLVEAANESEAESKAYAEIANLTEGDFDYSIKEN